MRADEACSHVRHALTSDVSTYRSHRTDCRQLSVCSWPNRLFGIRVGSLHEYFVHFIARREVEYIYNSFRAVVENGREPEVYSMTRSC